MPIGEALVTATVASWGNSSLTNEPLRSRRLKLQSLPQHPGLALDCERLLTAPSPVVEAGGGPSRNQASQPAVTPG